MALLSIDTRAREVRSQKVGEKHIIANLRKSNKMPFPFTHLVCLFLALLNLTFGTAQQNSPKSELLPASRVAAIFTDSVKKEFRLNYPIFRVYRYVDRSGEYYCVLTESSDSILND